MNIIFNTPSFQEACFEQIPFYHPGSRQPPQTNQRTEIKIDTYHRMIQIGHFHIKFSKSCYGPDSRAKNLFR